MCDYLGMDEPTLSYDATAVTIIDVHLRDSDKTRGEPYDVNRNHMSRGEWRPTASLTAGPFPK
eukprot:COSAG02_NODE_42458_length_384_cov_0.978947_2_plen_63_part_00